MEMGKNFQGNRMRMFYRFQGPFGVYFSLIVCESNYSFITKLVKGE